MSLNTKYTHISEGCEGRGNFTNVCNTVMEPNRINFVYTAFRVEYRTNF